MTEQNINEIFNDCLCGNNAMESSIIELTNYVYRRSIKSIRTQMNKWYTDAIHDESHFLSVTYNVVYKNIQKYRVLEPEMKLNYFTSICVKEVKLSVNALNKSLISDGNVVLTNSLSIENFSGRAFIDSGIVHDKDIDIENETLSKSVLSEIISAVDKEQAAIIAHRLQGLTFDEIAESMNLPKKRVLNQFYAIKNNPTVRKIYSNSKLSLKF